MNGVVSVIIPLHNASATIARALASIEAQTYAGPLEVCVYDDASSDDSVGVVRAWYAAAPRRSALQLLTPDDVGAQRDVALGPAFARNRAVAASTGAYLCMLDADDVAAPTRVAVQLAASAAHPHAIIGGGFVREPRDATPAYTAWAHGLSPRELVSQAWREVSLIQPTWFMARGVFLRVGGYDEAPSRLWWAAGAASVAAASAGDVSGGADSAGGDSACGNFADGVPAVEAAGAPAGLAAACSACAAARGFAASSMRVDVVPSAAPDGNASVPHTPPPLLTSVAPWPPEDAPQRHGAILSRPPLKLLPRALARGSGWAYDPRSSFPEDTVFLHRHLAAAAAGGGGSAPPLIRVPECVLTYTYSASGVSWRVPRALLMRLRCALWEEVAAAAGGAWARGFTVWGAGRDGKAFYGGLSPAARARVQGWVDIDPRKTRAGALYPPPARAPGGGPGPPRPVRHAARIADDVPGSAAVVVCVALDKGGAELRANLAAADAARVAAGGIAWVEGDTLLFMC